MIGKDDGERRWSIGEVARASGMTVRALRHYDEIGLLSASERIASGHRRYTESDVRRLYRVRALRTLGLSLEEIASVLADSADDLAAMREVLTAQLHGLESHAVRIQQLTHRLHGLLGQIDSASMPDPDQFMMTLEMISVFETTFTPEQREQLARRRAELGPEAVEAAKTEWAGLVEELLRHVRDDTPVDDPRVRALAAAGTRWGTGSTAKARTASGPRPPREGRGRRTASRSVRGSRGPWTRCATWSSTWSGSGRPDDAAVGQAG
ncbi:MerR family transcriptional regulator [Streptosporangium lutulentum]